VRLSATELAELRRRLATAPESAYEYIEGIGFSDGMDGVVGRGTHLDRAWAGLQYLLDLAGPPPVDVIGGGVALTDHNWDYDTPRLLTQDEVSKAADFLSSTPFDRLAEHFDVIAMGGVYPEYWAEDDLNYLADQYLNLVDFFCVAARQRQAVVVALA